MYQYSLHVHILQKKHLYYSKNVSELSVLSPKKEKQYILPTKLNSLILINLVFKIKLLYKFDFKIYFTRLNLTSILVI